MPEIDPTGFTLDDAANLPKFGGLTTGEDRLIGEALAEAPDIAKALAELCDLIGKAEGLSLLEARKIVTGDLDDAGERGQGLAEKYAAEIKAYQKVSREYGYLLMDATVNGIMAFRSGMDGWTQYHTDRMRRDVFLAVWRFAQDEITAEGIQQTAEVTEEAMGKPLPVKSASKRTGRRTSGS